MGKQYFLLLIAVMQMYGMDASSDRQVTVTQPGILEDITAVTLAAESARRAPLAPVVRSFPYFEDDDSDGWEEIPVLYQNDSNESDQSSDDDYYYAYELLPEEINQRAFALFKLLQGDEAFKHPLKGQSLEGPLLAQYVKFFLYCSEDKEIIRSHRKHLYPETTQKITDRLVEMLEEFKLPVYQRPLFVDLHKKLLEQRRKEDMERLGPKQRKRENDAAQAYSQQMSLLPPAAGLQAATRVPTSDL